MPGPGFGSDDMNTGKDHHDDRGFIAASFRSHWLLFVLVGALLIAAGGIAIIVPAVSSIAPNEVLGLVLAFVGIVQITQSAKMRRESLFAWHLGLGLLAAIGGVLVCLDPFPGFVTITLLMAIVFVAHGLTQIAFAVKVRSLKSWHWFLASGFIALLAAGLLVMKLPYDHSFTPATVGGVSLLFAGWAYVTVALGTRDPQRSFLAGSSK
jgi:uncharacterized membrane protein HdeD (DUF308 family)